VLQAKYPPIGNRGISGQGMHTGLLNSFSASPDIRPLGCYIRAMKQIDWTQCTLIETEPGKRGGKPVIKGTRLRPEDLFTNREQGIEWLVENHGGITPDTVRALFAFYDTHKAALVPHPA
jgi:uncharacterized protein (DUF433 family)